MRFGGWQRLFSLLLRQPRFWIQISGQQAQKLEVCKCFGKTLVSLSFNDKQSSFVLFVGHPCFYRSISRCPTQKSRGSMIWRLAALICINFWTPSYLHPNFTLAHSKHMLTCVLRIGTVNLLRSPDTAELKRCVRFLSEREHRYLYVEMSLRLLAIVNLEIESPWVV